MRGQKLYKKTCERIPGGTQLLSKRPEMFLPEIWPAYYKEAKGATVTDLDGKTYTDMSHFGIGACTLGYADEDIDNVVIDAIHKGVASTLNCPEEYDLAESLCKIHPWTDMVRYCRSGGEATSMAIRIARAMTGRDKVAFCGYHGWCDWYLAANLSDNKALDGQLLPGLQPKGVPRGLSGTAIPFHYNQVQELEEIISEDEDGIAAIIMEPIRDTLPKSGFLESVKKIAESVDAILIFDEISSGFRMNTGGIHMRMGVTPDMAVFAKAMANGYAMAAVIGREEVMNAAQSTFISSTNWTERIGPVAALATIEKYGDHDVPAHLIKIGNEIQNGWKEAGEENDIAITVSGIPPLSKFHFMCEDEMACSTYFTQEMLERSFLAKPLFYSSYAHNKEHVAGYLEAVHEIFGTLKKITDAGDIREHLQGPSAHQGFYRLTN